MIMRQFLCHFAFSTIVCEFYCWQIGWMVEHSPHAVEPKQAECTNHLQPEDPEAAICNPLKLTEEIALLFLTSYTKFIQKSTTWSKT